MKTTSWLGKKVVAKVKTPYAITKYGSGEWTVIEEDDSCGDDEDDITITKKGEIPYGVNSKYFNLVHRTLRDVLE